MEIEIHGYLDKISGRKYNKIHKSMVKHTHYNKNVSLINEDRRNFLEKSEMENHLNGFYQNLLTEPSTSITKTIQNITSFIPRLGELEKSEYLLREVSIS